MYFIKRRYKPFIVTIDKLGGAYVKIKRVFVGPKKLEKSCVKKIIVLVLDLIGDGVLATPALRTIRNNFPDAEITAAVGQWNKEIFENNPDVDKVEVINAFWARSTDFNLWQKIKSFIKIYQGIKKEKYDLGIDFRGEMLGIILLSRLGAQFKLGYGITGGGWMLDKCVNYKGDRFAKHAVERNLDLLRAIDLKISNNLDLAIYPTVKNKQVVDNFLTDNNIDRDNKIVVIHPGSNDQARCWDNEKWAEVAVWLIKDGYKVILSGGPNDEEVVKFIKLKAKSIIKNEKLETRNQIVNRQLPVAFFGCSILDFAELLSRVSLLLCVNSASLHIAAAQKVPTVVLFAGSYPKTYGPWPAYNQRGKQNLKNVVLFKDVKCFPCGKAVCENNKCMKDIEVSDVIKAIKSIKK